MTAHLETGSPEIVRAARKLSRRDSSHHARPVKLFVILSFVAIVATTAMFGFLLSAYLTRQMPYQDAIEATESLNALVQAEDAERGFQEGSHSAGTRGMATVIRYLQHLPDVYLATIYGANGMALWSTDETVDKSTAQKSGQLTAALNGELKPEIRPLMGDDGNGLSAAPAGATSFVTFTIPIWSGDKTSVIGAVEIRKVPETLLGSIDHVNYLTWTGEALAGTLLFCGLLFVVLYTTRVLRRHEARLIERERLAVVGEMASSVAHGLRNPLAAIRSSAELALDDDLSESARSSLSDIVAESERLENWIRTFLTHAMEDPLHAVGHTDVDEVVGKCLESFQSQMRDRGIVAEFTDTGRSPLVAAQPAELEQILNSIIANSIEAMRAGGKIKISRHVQPDGQARILIEDNGPGIPSEMIRRLFNPFESGKPAGLGVGLVLARQIVERLGGSLELGNRKRRGVEVMCTIPTLETLS